MSPKNKNFALVTGATSGIGLEIARDLARRGYSLILAARREDRLKSIQQELESKYKIKAVYHVVDLAVPGAATDLFDRVCEQGHVVDVLINNAGVGLEGDLIEQDSQALTQMLELNVVALTVLTRLFASNMVERGGGYILNVASVGGYQPCPYFAAYSASKAYVIDFSLAAHFELKSKGVVVTTLSPGVTRTEFFNNLKLKPSGADRLMTTPEQVAKLGLKALFNGQKMVIVGLMNNINAVLAQIMPTSLVTRVAGLTFKKMFK